jgi:hypothetical protein
VMTFATDNLGHAPALMLARTASSAVNRRARARPDRFAQPGLLPYSRRRNSNCTRGGMWSAGHFTVDPSQRATSSSRSFEPAPRQGVFRPSAAGVLSTSASVSMLGQAQSSPMVSGATRW